MGYLTPSISPSILPAAATISFSTNPNVYRVIGTVDGTSPTISQYICYDTLSPRNPFIATIQDGRGNMLFDGGFPKWYNIYCNAGWTTFSQLNGAFKYLYNALNWLANPTKIAAGNRKVLFIGDSPIGSNYCITGVDSYSFKTSFSKVASVGGWIPTFMSGESFVSNMMDLTYAQLDQYCCIVFMSSLYTMSKYITDSLLANLVAYREAGNGIFIITDHGDAGGQFYRTANYVANKFGVTFSGLYNRTPVNVGWIRANYGDHPLYANLLDTEAIQAGDSESRVYIPADTSAALPAPVLVNAVGSFTNIKWLILLKDGSMVSETYSYGLGVAQSILHSYLDTLPITALDLFLLTFDIAIGTFAEVKGLIKRNTDVLGDFSKKSTGLTVTWYDTVAKNNFIVRNNDIIKIEITSPYAHSRSITVTKYVPNFKTLSLSELIISNYKARATSAARVSCAAC